MNILWTETVKHNTLNWDLLYSEDGGLSWSILKEDIALEARSHQWVVPDVLTSKGRIKIIQDNAGEDYESSSQNFTIAPLSSHRDLFKLHHIRAFPNPMKDFATIEAENPENNGNTLIIYDCRGVAAQSVSAISPGKFELRRGSLPAGMYILHLVDGRQVRASGKLIIR